MTQANAHPELRRIGPGPASSRTLQPPLKQDGHGDSSYIGCAHRDGDAGLVWKRTASVASAAGVDSRPLLPRQQQYEQEKHKQPHTMPALGPMPVAAPAPPAPAATQDALVKRRRRHAISGETHPGVGCHRAACPRETAELPTLPSSHQPRVPQGQTN